MFAEAHHVFVDGVVEDFFDEDVDSVVVVGAVAEFADVHAGSPTDVFAPVEGFDVVFVVVGGVGGRFGGVAVVVDVVFEEYVVVVCHDGVSVDDDLSAEMKFFNPIAQIYEIFAKKPRLASVDLRL